MYISSLFSFFSFLSFFGEKIQRGTKAAHNEHYNYRYICLISKDSALDFFFWYVIPVKNYEKKSFTVYENNFSIESFPALNIPLIPQSLALCI